MDIQIKEVQKVDTEAFAKEQWATINKKYDFLPAMETFYFGVYSGEELLAYAQTEIRGGVAETRSLLVKDGLTGNGIGTKLISFIENWAKKEKQCVKLIVKTSSGWPKSVNFYIKNGYKKDAVLPKYYFGIDWYYMSNDL